MGRILVVDDERSMRDFLEILLQREGHEVVACGSAEQALLAIDDRVCSVLVFGEEHRRNRNVQQE